MKEEEPHLHHRDRLWAKLEQLGFKGAFFHPYEQLEFLLTLVLPRRDTKPIAKALLERFGDVSSVLLTPPETLRQVAGVGKRVALFLRALGELYESMSGSALQKRDLLDHPDLVARYLELGLKGEEAEYFVVLHLDARNRLMHSERMFRGTVDRAPVFPREVARSGLAHNARALIVAHNHPSGDGTPSATDLQLTRELMDALRTVDLLLLDHFVVAREGTVSIRQAHPQLW